MLRITSNYYILSAPVCFFVHLHNLYSNYWSWVHLSRETGSPLLMKTGSYPSLSSTASRAPGAERELGGWMRRRWEREGKERRKREEREGGKRGGRQRAGGKSKRTGYSPIFRVTNDPSLPYC